jgi:ligand-binding sensor domain-containing protein/signal transduction histidine kinase
MGLKPNYLNLTLKCLFFICLVSSLGYSQPLKFEHLNTRTGLSHNSVLSIRQDSRGYMWFGTYGGLNKYDGYRITTYKSEHGNDNTLKTNAIVAIYEDSDNMLWFGTYGGGVVNFDPRKEIFTEYRYLHLDPKGPVTPNVRGLLEDKEGFLWMATSEGLVKYDKKKKSFTPFLVKSDVHSENNITSIYPGKAGDFWLGSYLGLKHFDPKTGQFTSYHPDPLQPNSISHANVLTVYEDQQGTVWVGTEGGGLDAFDPITGIFTHYKNNPADENTVSGNVIFSIEPYVSGKLIIATESGLNVLDLKTGKFQHISHDPEEPSSLSSNNTRCIYKDAGGVLWIGTDGGGVSRTDLNRKKFTTFQHEPGEERSLSNNNVFTITEDANRNIWLGTIEGGLNRFDNKTKTFTTFTPDTRNRKSISSTKILSLATGPSKNLWIGTDRDGLCMLPAQHLDKDVNQAAFYRYRKDEGPSSLNSNVIYSLVEDRASVVWAGTWSRGLNKIEFKSKNQNGAIDYTKPQVTHYRRSDEPNSISHDVIFTLYEDKKGTLWIGTVGGGLNKKETITVDENGARVTRDIFKHYINDPGDTASLSDNNVSAIYESSKGDFWVGTSLGISKMDRAHGTFKAYTTKDGLPNNVVFGIVEDNKGNLWIGTLGGVSKFDPVKETFKNYGFEDGLQDNMFNPHAFCLSQSGEMFFGGPNGMTVFYPDSIRDNAYEPKVMLTDFKVFNKSVPIGKNDEDEERLKQSVSTVDEITLSYKDYVFSFEFSASNYASASKNKFAYKMEGFDKDWVYTDASNRIATYTNLDPGNYTFRVKASNGDGVWTDKAASVKIAIVPPFWQTLWFRLLILAEVLAGLYIIYKIRINIIKKQKQDLEIQVASRTKEIVAQKEEIQSQKESIEEKNVALEQQYHQIEAARSEIKEKNQKLEEYNLQLEQKVKERTNQLRHAFNHLAETNKELDQFIYRSAHDLKGPLATIRGLCYLGSLETTDPKVIGLLKKMENTTGELTSKLSRLMKIHEFNSMELVPTNIDYEELLKEIVAEVKSSIVVTDVQIKMDINRDGNYKSDKRLTKTLLRNIIENSIKYKDPNKSLHYVNIQVQSQSNSTKISIRDNGIGIPQDQADQIFDLFVTATEGSKSFGIGLYESKLIARRLNGNIKLQYPENGDTEFVITL